MKGKIKKVMTFLAVVGLMAIGAAVIVGLIVGVITGLVNIGRYVSGNLRPASVLTADVPEYGVGRAAVVRYGTVVCADEAEVGLPTYTEGEGPAPEWYRPEEPMAVEWMDNARQSDLNPIQRTDAGCPDWNVDSTLYGWDGHTAEAWEMDVFSRIVYLEFNGTELECMNAGIDSILNLWDSEYFGRTLFDTLSATAENGALVYTTYGYVWEWDYDYDVLEEIKTLCAERFINGPQYGCHFFQLYGFPWWAVPCYEIDGVYFSTGWGW